MVNAVIFEHSFALINSFIFIFQSYFCNFYILVAEFPPHCHIHLFMLLVQHVLATHGHHYLHLYVAVSWCTVSEALIKIRNSKLKLMIKIQVSLLQRLKKLVHLVISRSQVKLCCCFLLCLLGAVFKVGGWRLTHCYAISISTWMQLTVWRIPHSCLNIKWKHVIIN